MLTTGILCNAYWGYGTPCGLPSSCEKLPVANQVKQFPACNWTGISVYGHALSRIYPTTSETHLFCRLKPIRSFHLCPLWRKFSIISDKIVCAILISLSYVSRTFILPDLNTLIISPKTYQLWTLPLYNRFSPSCYKHSPTCAIVNVRKVRPKSELSAHTVNYMWVG
jgi:hypothetical protein